MEKASRSLNHQGRILEAASEIFLELGFEKTSTAEIARRAKVSKRELYSCFADKRAILTAVITQLQHEIHSQMDVNWSSKADIRLALSQSGVAILSFLNSERFGKLFRMVAAESFHDPVTARQFYLLGPAAGRKDTAAFLAQHMKAGTLRKADPLQAADDLLDLIVSARFMTAVALGQNDAIPDIRKHVKHAVDMFLVFYAPRQAKTLHAFYS
jgi:AcrR family transcriptional regulator